jgi:predicted nucleotidyltransferase
MEAKEFDFEFPRGNTFEFVFELEDEQGLPIKNVTEIYFTIKNNYKEEEFVLQKKLTTGEIIFKDGTVTISITQDDTSNLEFRKYDYDVAVKIEDFFRTILIGKMSLTKNVTHKSNE